MITRDDLIRVGRACFGENWQNDVSRELQVSPRIIRYWLTGRPIPENIKPELCSMASRRQIAIWESTRDFYLPGDVNDL
jgi:hypothetical protein